MKKKSDIKFSVITPVHIWSEDRREWLFRAIKSLKNQTYQNYEHIIINDGSTLDVEIPSDDHTVVINQVHEERVIAFSSGFALARGDWFVILDSDDEFDPQYLEKCVSFIKKYPKYKMFNFGCKYIHKDGGTALRDAFLLPKKKVGHEIFGGGNVVSGTFIWHRSIYDDIGAFPQSHITNIDTTDINYGGVRDLYMGSPYDFSAYAQLEFPEIRKYYMVKHPDHPKHLVKELGNPWGQDYYLFYKYTRKYHSKPILGEYLYWVHPR